MIDAETREVIEWLESLEGRLWSRTRHFQSRYQNRLFSLKDDEKGTSGDSVWEQEWISWGKVGISGLYIAPKPRTIL